jgi:hypothetical protein
LVEDPISVLCRDRRWRWLRPSLTFLEASLLCYSTPPVQIWSTVQLRGKPLILSDRTMAAPWCRTPLWGFVFGAGQRQAGLVEGQSVHGEAYVATMVGMSDVGDVALVEIVGSSSACPWVGLGLFVAVKSKLRWWVPVAYDDWRQVVCSAIFHGASLAWFFFVVLPQSRSCAVLSQVAVLWRGSSCGFVRPLQSWLVRRLCFGKVGVVCSEFVGWSCCFLGEK